MRIVLSALRIVFTYALFSTLWILFSDSFLHYLVNDADKLSIIQTYKGLFFIGVTTLLLFILIKTQLSQLERIQRKMKENEQRLQYVIQGANLGYWDWDYVTNKHLVNDTWLSFLGLTREDIKAELEDWSSRIHNEDKQIPHEAIEKTIRDGKPYVVEFRMQHKDGHWVWIEGSGAVVERDEGTGKPLRLAGTHRDISERKSSQEKILFLAMNDPLTALPNRTYLKQALEALLEEKNPMAFLFLDLDFFKNINDIYGHSIGDRVIQEVALRFKESLQEGDFIARVGGDEFVILVKKPLHVETLCFALIQGLEKPFDIVEEAFKLGVSIGIASFPKDGETFESLFKNADTAMYAAKNSGKNRFMYYNQTMTDVIFKSTTLDNEMQRALDEDAFLLHYQPQIDLGTGEVVGVEALVRWLNPKKGLIPPFDFIPRAEENRLIIPLGDIIFKKAIEQLKKWQEREVFTGIMAINISGVQISEPHFVDRLESIRQAVGIDASKIELEVTESFIMKNAKESIATLQKLKTLGFSISVDDFGTGYSSLSYLKTLPIHKLKIDRSFVKDLPEDKDDRAIVRAIISLAKNLELEVLAEGVETAAQKEFLIENWCDSAQGYLFAKPMSSEDFEVYLHKN